MELFMTAAGIKATGTPEELATHMAELPGHAGHWKGLDGFFLFVVLYY